MRARPEVPVADRVLVPFKAEGHGVDELSWGQQELWMRMRPRRIWLPLSSVVPLPAGTTVDDVAAKLRFMMGRYPTLRTTLRLDPDGTRQVVADQGEVPLEVVDLADDGNPAQAGDRMGLQYMDRDYDFATEWPVRMAVVCHRGVPTHQVMVLCHLVLDGTGAAVMTREMAGWDRTLHDGTVALSAMPPLEQVRRQRLPAARRHSDTAMRYWEQLLRAAPPRRFGNLGGEQRPRYWKGRLNSPATHVAVRSIASRTRVDSSSVLLALYAVTMARITGVNPVLVQVLVSNRFRPGFADTVSPIFQTGLCMIDVADVAIDEVAADARYRTMATYKHAYYDPRQCFDLIARVSRERGEEVELGCYFNDRRFRAQADDLDPTPELLRTALPLSRFEWVTVEDIAFTEPVEVFVDDGDAPGALAISVSADTRHLSPAAMERLVRTMEAIAVEAAFDPAARTRVPGTRASRRSPPG